MDRVYRFGVSMEPELLAAFDELSRRRGYTSRSEAIRHIVRGVLVEEEWADADREVIGTVTLVYDHHAHDLPAVLMDLQHEFHESVVCTTHVHMDAHNCLEVVVVRGTASTVRQIGNRLISARGVKHGRLTCSTTGADLE
jgi:CopG family nickel-responsive transcriptional regulator